MTAWLLTWLLQGIAVAVLVGVGLRGSSRLNAATRYVVWCVALGVVTAMGLFTLPATSSPVVEHAPDVVRGGLEQAPVFYVDAVPDSILAIFVGVWAAVALVKLVRLIPGLHAVYALRDRCRSFPRPLELRLDLWREVKGQGRRTELLLCDALPGATVLGFHRPCVALPPSLIRALTADDLDQIILHEYAHVQRRDDWGRLAQAFVQAVLWVHPAAAIIGRAMNREREMACDEWVVARTGSPKGYARCLTRAAETRASSGRAHTLMPALFGAQHDLVRRVERLLTNTRPRRGVSPAAAAIALSVMLVAAVQLGSVRLVAEIGEITASLGSVRGPNHLDSLRAPRRLEPPPSEISSASLVEIAPGPVLAARQVASGTPAADHSDGVTAEPFVATQDVTPQAEPGLTVATLESRSFHGVYANQPGNSEPFEQPGTWRRVGIAAAQIGIGAGRTGAGIGNAFSRAGVSVARRF